MLDIDCFEHLIDLRGLRLQNVREGDESEAFQRLGRIGPFLCGFFRFKFFLKLNLKEN